MECNICGYEWQPRVANPKACPSCKYRFDYLDASLKRKQVLEAIKEKFDEEKNEADS